MNCRMRTATEHEYELFMPKPGEHRIRILQTPPKQVIAHFVQAADGSWRRFICAGPRECVLCVRGHTERVRLWIFPIYDRLDQKVKIWSIRQVTIKRAINDMAKSWGDPTLYDICLTRTGMGMDTEYRLIPFAKPKPMSDHDRGLILPDLDEHVRIETMAEIDERLGRR
ncbi:MAG: hypothetical protein GXP25_15890 [Planctomycetes bacterium]|nr:hypothetical protein [Planctomycetota bacterium]